MSKVSKGSKGESNNGMRATPLFAGVSLEEILARQPKSPYLHMIKSAPVFYCNLLANIYARRGLRRLITNEANVHPHEVELFKEVLENDELYDLSEFEAPLLCRMLKLFLQDLPDAVFTCDNYSSFMDAYDSVVASKASDRNEFEEEIFFTALTDELSVVVAMLPECNQQMLFLLFHVLHAIQLHQQSNETTIDQLTTVFAAAALRPPAQYAYPTSMSEESIKVETIFACFITQFKHIFDKKFLSESLTFIQFLLQSEQDIYSRFEAGPSASSSTHLEVLETPTRSKSTSFGRGTPPIPPHSSSPLSLSPPSSTALPLAAPTRKSSSTSNDDEDNRGKQTETDDSPQKKKRSVSFVKRLFGGGKDDSK